MKRLTHCPHCQAKMKENDLPPELNNLKYEQCAERCVVDYAQHYEHSYQEQEPWYICFNTPKDQFLVYIYSKRHKNANLTHVYSVIEMERKGSGMPLLTLENLEYDLDKLDVLEEKLEIYSLVS